MPRVKLGRPKDPLMELIAGRKHVLNLKNAEIARRAHMTEDQVKNRMKRPTEEWKLGDIRAICSALEIPKEDLRARI